jgi:hypothetical protein
MKRPKEADIAFDKLNDSGKMKKLLWHIEGKWPVPSSWVQWLIDRHEQQLEDEGWARRD